MTSGHQSYLKRFLPILLIFIIVSFFSLLFKNRLRAWNLDVALLAGGNILLFLVTAVSFSLYRKALIAGNTQVFLRNVYGGMFLKFFVCLIAAFIYIFNAGTGLNKPGLFTVMGLYLVYTFLEVAILMKQSRQIKMKKNG